MNNDSKYRSTKYKFKHTVISLLEAPGAKACNRALLIEFS